VQQARSAVFLPRWPFRRCVMRTRKRSACVASQTQTDLADMTGPRRQTVNSAIKRLKQEGIIEVAHRQITILNGEALEAFASERSL